MSAADIARGLPKARKMGSSWWACCPAHDDHDPSLKIDQLRDGRVLVKCWAGCPQGAVIDALRSLGLWGNSSNLNSAWSAASAARWSTSTTPTSEADRTARARALWREARDPRGTAVDAYRAGRGLALPAEAAGEAIRFHPEAPFRLNDGSTVRMPTMVCLLRDIVTDEPCGVHRTALKPNGSGKAEMPDGSSPKKMYGLAKGAVVKLTPDADVLDGLGLAEGIETALAIMSAGWRPVWACGSAGSISTFPTLAVQSLTVFADADPAGLAAAKSCQTRWLAAGCEATIILPPDDGQDWADVTVMP